MDRCHEFANQLYVLHATDLTSRHYFIFKKEVQISVT